MQRVENADGTATCVQGLSLDLLDVMLDLDPGMLVWSARVTRSPHEGAVQRLFWWLPENKLGT